MYVYDSIHPPSADLIQRGAVSEVFMEAEDGGVSKSTAVAACTAMALFYVAILYSPTLILRLPPPTSFKSYMIRRFVCAAVSSLISVVFSALILPVSELSPSLLYSHLFVCMCFCVYGCRCSEWRGLGAEICIRYF